MMIQYHPLRKSSFVNQLTGIAVMVKGSRAAESEVRHDPLTPVEPRLIFVSYCIISLIHGLVCLKVHNAHTNWPKLSFCCNLKFFGQKLYKLPSLQIFSSVTRWWTSSQAWGSTLFCIWSLRRTEEGLQRERSPSKVQGSGQQSSGWVS